MRELYQKRAVLISYLELKLAECDWHGVSDAANDLRELEVVIKFAEATEKQK